MLAYFVISILLITSLTSVSESQSLCDRPIINAADRMVDNTVRLYRDQYYWVLNGLPGETGSLDGPFPIPFENMAPVKRNDSVVTLLGGTDRGKTVKTEGKSYWMWDDKGNLKTDKSGLIHNRFPSGGFDAVIHDGNPDDPTLIGFKGIKTYYLSTRYQLWTIEGNPSGYIGGKYKENFPTDVTAAFTLTAPDPEDEYIVYFFQKDKYCKRSKISKSGQECDEWLPNKQLFGCQLKAEVFDNSDPNASNASIDSNQTSPKPVNDGSDLNARSLFGFITSSLICFIFFI